LSAAVRTLPFVKMEAIGNDFPVLLTTDVAALLGPSVSVDNPQVSSALHRLAAMMSDRHFGVGGDGLLTIHKEGDGVRLRMFNPDGTEDFCGNGIRVAAKLANDVGWVGNDFSMFHRERTVPIHIEGTRIDSTLGLASYEPDKVPHTALGPLVDTTIWSGMDSGLPLSFFGSALTTGSTHVVIPTDKLPDDDSFASVSAKIEVDSKFPERTSVIWTKVVEPKVLAIRIWERGVGETQGCGTGSSAAAADYLRRTKQFGVVEVRNPGGTVWVKADGWNLPLTISGEARTVYRGSYSIPDGLL